jgi:hypothetical protein
VPVGYPHSFQDWTTESKKETMTSHSRGEEPSIPHSVNFPLPPPRERADSFSANISVNSESVESQQASTRRQRQKEVIENRAVASTKILVILVLILGAVVAAIAANSYTKIAEEEDFQTRVSFILPETESERESARREKERETRERDFLKK